MSSKRNHRLFGRAVAWAAVSIGAAPLAAQESPDVQTCYAERAALFESRREPFSTHAQVVCPSAGNGQAPRERAETVLTYEAPPGYLIAGETVEVRVINSHAGRHDAPIISPDRVALPLRCESPSAGSPEAFHEVELAGELRRIVTPQIRDEIIADCRGISTRPDNLASTVRGHMRHGSAR
jgi:hypothetical protein